MLIHMNYFVTTFPTIDAAKAIAEANANDDTDTTYVVERRGAGYVIAVYDEDGEFVFYL